MNSLNITSVARLHVLAVAAALTCAAFVNSARADCPSPDQPVVDAFAVAEDADLPYLPFTLGEAQDEHASLNDRGSPDAAAIASDEPIVLAGSFEFD